MRKASLVANAFLISAALFARANYAKAQNRIEPTATASVNNSTPSATSSRIEGSTLLSVEEGYLIFSNSKIYNGNIAYKYDNQTTFEMNKIEGVGFQNELDFGGSFTSNREYDPNSALYQFDSANNEFKHGEHKGIEPSTEKVTAARKEALWLLKSPEFKTLKALNEKKKTERLSNNLKILSKISDSSKIVSVQKGYLLFRNPQLYDGLITYRYASNAAGFGFPGDIGFGSTLVKGEYDPESDIYLVGGTNKFGRNNGPNPPTLEQVKLIRLEIARLLKTDQFKKFIVSRPGQSVYRQYVPGLNNL